MAKKKVEKVIEVVEQEEIQPIVVQEEVVIEKDVVIETLPLEEQGIVEEPIPFNKLEDVEEKLSLLDSLHTPFYGKVLQLKEMVQKGASKQEILDELVGFQTISQEALGKFISLL